MKHFKKRLEALKRQWRLASKSRKRAAFYGYLEQVYGLYQELRAAGSIPSAKVLVRKADASPALRKASLVKLLIDVTCAEDLKTRSRWGRALQSFHRSRHVKRGLIAFLNKNGGIAGAARRIAKPKEKMQDWDSPEFDKFNSPLPLGMKLVSVNSDL